MFQPSDTGLIEKVSPFRVQLLLTFQPGLGSARNRAGQTPLVCLLSAPASVQRSPTFDAAQHSEAVELLAGATQAGCTDRAAAAADAAVGIEMHSDATWQFTLQLAEEAAEAGDEAGPDDDDAGGEPAAGGGGGIRVGAAAGPFPCEKTWTLSTDDGRLHGDGAVPSEAVRSVSAGDTVKFTLRGHAISVDINGVDGGACFEDVQLPIRPYVRLAGSSRKVVKLGPMTLFDAEEGRQIAIISALLDTSPEVLHTPDAQSRLPVHIAHQNNAPAAVQDLILRRSVEHGVVWCGKPIVHRGGAAAAAAAPEFGIHAVLHALDRRDGTDKQLQEAVFDACLAGMSASSDQQFRDITRISGLPFDSAEVRSVAVSSTHIAFLLVDGRVFRTAATINQKKAEKPAREIPEKLELREVSRPSPTRTCPCLC